MQILSSALQDLFATPLMHHTMVLWGVGKGLTGDGKYYSWGTRHLLPGDTGFLGWTG